MNTDGSSRRTPVENISTMDPNAPRGTIFIIDDEEQVRGGLQRLVRSAGWAVEVFPSAESFMKRLPYDGVGCVLLDVQMPSMSGPELQKQMLAMGISLPVVYLTGHADVPMSVHAMKNGAIDILMKPAEDDVVLDAIAAAIAKHEHINSEAAKKIHIGSRLARLSAREREVMEFVISGRLNKQIASDLGISEKTVKAHRARVMEKLETRSVAALVRMCEIVAIEPRHHAPDTRLRQ
jgi:two-component system, LuxR family, response regulator FixJ